MEARQLSGESVEANVRHVVKALMGLNDTAPADLAAALRIGRSSLSERMTGKRRFTVAEVYDLAAFFRVKPGLFFQDPQELTARLFDSGYRSDVAPPALKLIEPPHPRLPFKLPPVTSSTPSLSLV